MSTITTGLSSTNAFVVTADTTGTLALTPASGIVDSSGATGALVLASGTTAQRPSVPAAGSIRYNSSISSVEAYYSGAWNGINGGAIDGIFLPTVATLTSTFTSTSGTNYLSTGPITQSAGVVTINSGSLWKVV